MESGDGSFVLGKFIIRFLHDLFVVRKIISWGYNNVPLLSSCLNSVAKVVSMRVLYSCLQVVLFNSHSEEKYNKKKRSTPDICSNALYAMMSMLISIMPFVLSCHSPTVRSPGYRIVEQVKKFSPTFHT